jgi:hypothetical protein
MKKTNFVVKGEDLEKLEDEVREEMAAIIGDYANDKRGSTIRDMQPPESIIQAMAVAATQVLMAFERGYRMGD